MTAVSSIDHAVVLGGSMAGLLAAAALARHARRVTVVDRDAFVDEPSHRKGTPQDHQPHLLLDRGRQAIEHLVPGLFEELVDHGSRCIDAGRDLWLFHYGRWKVRCDTRYRLYLQTRILLEHHVRRRIQQLPNVELRPRTEVLEPRFGEGGVRGVRLQPVGTTAATEEPCDVLVDTLGRGSRSPAWLAASGYDTVQEDRVRIDLGYAGRLYRRPPGVCSEWAAYVIYGNRPTQRRHGLVFSVEDDGWLVALAGYEGDHPPSDPAGFEAFARTLDRPDLHELLREAEPLTAPRLFKVPYQRWCRYDRLSRLPRGYAVIGDALASFDPVFGQGISVAAVQAEALERQLAEHGRFDARAFARRCARIVGTPWMVAVGEAMRYPGVEGTAPPGLPILHRFLDRVFECSTTDPEVYRAFLDVMQMHAGPEALFRPQVLWRLLRGRPAAIGAAVPVLDPG